MKRLTVILVASLCLFGSRGWLASGGWSPPASLPPDGKAPLPVVAQLAAQAGDFCPALPITGHVVNVSDVNALVDAFDNASPGDTILIANGTYALNGAYLRIATANVTLRSASGNREAVILDGNYLTTEIVQIVASNATIADLTLREAYYHPIQMPFCLLS